MCGVRRHLVFESMNSITVSPTCAYCDLSFRWQTVCMLWQPKAILSFPLSPFTVPVVPPPPKCEWVDAYIVTI